MWNSYYETSDPYNIIVSVVDHVGIEFFNGDQMFR